jgi:acetylglutamate kinase
MIVIKCGGSTLDALSDAFYQDLVKIGAAIVVHGGGPAINAQLKINGVEAKFVNGLRVTDAATLQIVQMVLIGKTNKEIVTRIQKAGGKAVGLSGIDGSLLVCEQADPALGFVGKVKKVNTDVLDKLDGYIPVIAPLGVDENGQVYNINADVAAGAVAAAVGAKRLVLVTDVAGVMKDGQIIEELNEKEIAEMIEDGTIYGGMIPKVNAALDGLAQGVSEVVITNKLNGKGTVIKK